MNKIYKIVRKRFPMNVMAIHHFGKLLISYYESDLASPNLIDELETYEEGKLWSNIWEALLFNYLTSQKIELIKGRRTKQGHYGPDFSFRHNGKIVWIEAVVPEPIGIPEEHLKPICTVKKFKVDTEPHEQKLLRWTAAIKEKRDKIAGYIEDGLISQDDCAVIAVNSCRLQDYAFDDRGISQLPYAVEATFPIGPIAIPLTKDGQVAGPSQNLSRPFLLNKNNAKVPTDNFFDPRYQIISAVIGSHQRDLWTPLHLSLVHNHKARNPMEQHFLRTSNEFVCSQDEDCYQLKNVAK